MKLIYPICISVGLVAAYTTKEPTIGTYFLSGIFGAGVGRGIDICQRTVKFESLPDKDKILEAINYLPED